MRKPAKLGLLFVLTVLVSGWSAGAAPTPAKSPYQGEIPFKLGQPLDPGVSIDGVVWNEVQVTPKGKLSSGRAVKTEILLRFHNTTADHARVFVVLLFEDEHGESLDRLELKPTSLGAGKTRRVKEKVKIQSDVLTAARKLYLFCEVRR